MGKETLQRNSFAEVLINKKGDVLGKGFQDKIQFSDNRSQTVTIDFDDYVGEVVMLDTEVIHLLLARKII